MSKFTLSNPQGGAPYTSGVGMQGDEFKPPKGLPQVTQRAPHAAPLARLAAALAKVASPSSRGNSRDLFLP